MSSLFRFDCVFYYVSDLDRAIEFYSRVLGLHLTSRDAVARFRIDGVLFELVPARDAADLDGRGNARLCLAVDDIQAAAAELEARGVTVSEVRFVSNGALASFEDPDGNEITVWQDARPPSSGPGAPPSTSEASTRISRAGRPATGRRGGH